MIKNMNCKIVCVLITALAHIISAGVMCPNHPTCKCGGTFAVELNCDIDGQKVVINLLPNTYMNIKCHNVSSLDYSKLPKFDNEMNIFKSVSFKDCPLPAKSFQEVLTQMGINKTMSLIFQNSRTSSGYFKRGHFTGLQNLSKLLLSVNGITYLPDNVFTDINNLTWLNIRCNNMNLSEELFKPLEKLETLEISHNHLTNISTNLFSHLSLLKKLSLWQSNITLFSKDFFIGVDVLEELDLSSNGLNELPVSIFNPLKKLKKLTLFSNKFSTLPQNLFSSNDMLETVIILNNDVKMKELPSYLFGNLTNLKQVYMQRSGIEYIPSSIFINSPEITNISLAYNEIKLLHEATFNDQINLLELDLSYNQLKNLATTIFSSLVRLESLHLGHNSIEEINGSTFSSLLSLIYLNMEYNNLKTISSYLFTNNKQRMIISLAYNQLKFVNKKSKNCTKASPFALTYNLNVLNLSHNNFKMVYKDWWTNGHDYLDLSFNSIEDIWDQPGYDMGFNDDTFDVIKRPMKEVSLTNNSIICRCLNFHMIDYIQEKFGVNIVNNPLLDCSFLSRQRCYKKYTIIMTACSFCICLIATGIVILSNFNEYLDDRLKHKVLGYLKPSALKNPNKSITVKYSVNDEEFVLKEIIPNLILHKKKEVNLQPINGAVDEGYNHLLNIFEAPQMFLVVFTTNYLKTAYGHIDIRKIRDAMMTMPNTVYIFTDFGTEDSFYAYLREQRDLGISILWSDPNIWNKLTTELLHGFYKIKIKLSPDEEKLQRQNDKERLENEMLDYDPTAELFFSQV